MGGWSSPTPSNPWWLRFPYDFPFPLWVAHEPQCLSNVPLWDNSLPVMFFPRACSSLQVCWLLQANWCPQLCMWVMGSSGRRGWQQSSAGQHPPAWGPSSLGSWDSWWSIPAGRSLGLVLSFIPSVPSAAPQTSTAWCWSQVHRQDVTSAQVSLGVAPSSSPPSLIHHCSSYQPHYFWSQAFLLHISVSSLHCWTELTYAVKYFPLLNQSLCTCMQTY